MLFLAFAPLLAVEVIARPYQPIAVRHDVAALFRRQETTYPSAGSIPETSTIPKAWLDRLAQVDVPNIPLGVGEGRPSYGDGVSPTSPEICSFTYECDHPDDLKAPPPGTIAMTFDDGPSGGSQSLATYLQEQGRRGSFTHFMIGSFIQRNPDMYKTIAEQGHIAVHTWSHNYMTLLTNEQVVAELGWSMQIMADMNGGRIPMYWRPPFGDVDNRVRAIAKGVFGLETVTWSHDTGDWNLDQGRDTTVQTITDTYRGWLADKSQGLNVLHHEVRDSQVDAFKAVFPALTGDWEVKNVADAWGKPWYQNAQTGNDTVTPMSVGDARSSASGSVSRPAASSGSTSATSSASGSSPVSASSTAPSQSAAPTQLAVGSSTGAASRTGASWMVGVLALVMTYAVL